MMQATAKTTDGGVSVSQAERREWDRLVSRFADRTVYHSLAWIETLEEAHGLRPLLLRATVDGECAAVWPCLELFKGPIRVVGSPLPGWSTAYMGPLFAEDADVEAVMRGFMAQQALRRASYVECRVVDACREVDLTTAGFTAGLRFETYLLDVRKTEAELWTGLERSCRNKIRKAEKAGTTVDDIERQALLTIPMGRLGKPEELGAVVAFLASPEASYVSVAEPRRTVIEYRLRPCITWSTNFVALPIATGRTPVASGSSVPAWPTFCWPVIRLIRRQTSIEVRPAPLFTFKKPPVIC